MLLILLNREVDHRVDRISQRLLLELLVVNYAELQNRRAPTATTCKKINKIIMSE